MAAAIEIRYEDDDDENPIATITAVHVKATGLDAYSADPTEEDPSHVVDETYYIKASKGSTEKLRSQIFTPSVDEGVGYWDGGLIFPESGSYTFRVMKRGVTDSQVATQSITVDVAP